VQAAYSGQINFGGRYGGLVEDGKEGACLSAGRLMTFQHSLELLFQRHVLADEAVVEANANDDEVVGNALGSDTAKRLGRYLALGPALQGAGPLSIFWSG